jgi:hypothetical protein
VRDMRALSEHRHLHGAGTLEVGQRGGGALGAQLV